MLHRAPGTPAAATPAVEQLIFAHALQAAGGDGAVEVSFPLEPTIISTAPPPYLC